MSRRPVVLALAWLFLAGCFQEVASDIPCDGDQSCPTGYWCTWESVCQDLAKETPPELVLQGAATSAQGPFGSSVVIPRKGGVIALQIANHGGSDVPSAEVSLSGPACFDLDETLGPDEVGTIHEGETVVTHPTTVTPSAPCPNHTIQVEIRLSQGPTTQRIWTGSFTATLGE
jgi:hypothetical protein